MSLKNIAISAVAAVVLTACSQNPATGKNEFTLVSPAQERQIGAEQHPKMVQHFGGIYDEGMVGGYVAAVGGRVAGNTGTSANGYHFTLLDSPVINAFALPGGYVYVTRGLLALANNEAELASVLGHEIGHVTARHGAKRQTQSTLISLLAIGLGVAFQNDLVNQASQIAGAYFVTSYSRDQEYEADQLGVGYINRTGYDPYGAPRFLQQMDRNTQLMAKLAGQEGRSNAMDFFATHPPAPDRVRRAAAKAGTFAGPGEKPALRDAYLDQIDGMIYGDSPEEGFVRGRKFLHPVLKMGFEVPEGFYMMNSSQAVVARGPNNSAIQFDAAPVDPRMSTSAFIRDVWAKGAQIDNVETIDVNGFKGATTAITLNQQGGSMTYRLIALRIANDKVHRFLMAAPTRTYNQLAEEFRRTTYSYRRLSDREVANLKPYRLRVVTVGRGDSVRSLAARMPYDRYNEDRFRVLNAMGPNDTLRAGQRVKIVTAQ